MTRSAVFLRITGSQQRAHHSLPFLHPGGNVNSIPFGALPSLLQQRTFPLNRAALLPAGDGRPSGFTVQGRPPFVGRGRAAHPLWPTHQLRASSGAAVRGWYQQRVSTAVRTSFRLMPQTNSAPTSTIRAKRTLPSCYNDSPPRYAGAALACQAVGAARPNLLWPPFIRPSCTYITGRLLLITT